jgi:hypothetical protein
VQTQPITPQLLLQGLATIKNETLGGLIPPTSYPAVGQTHAENLCYYSLRFNGDGSVTAPDRSTYKCLPPP